MFNIVNYPIITVCNIYVASIKTITTPNVPPSPLINNTYNIMEI